MCGYQTIGRIRLSLLGPLFASLLTAALSAQAGTPSNHPGPTKATPSSVPAHAGSPSHYQPDPFAGKAGSYYRLVWGVDLLNVKAAESGELIRFSYRILDPQKSKILNDKKIEAYLNSPERHVQLVIPSLEKVGQLRQSNTPESGKSYWMAFSNPHRAVKPGDRVNVVIGQFHADGLVVQ